MGKGLWIIIAGAGLTLLLFFRTHRKLCTLQEKMDLSFDEVDRFMECRVNVYTKWAETVAAYDLNEQGMLAEMMIIRDQFTEMTAEEKLRLCGKLDLFYDRMTDSAERCPKLRTSPLYIQLHERVDEMIREMPNACSYYNEYAGQLNEAISRFPANITAVLFGFEKKELLSNQEKKSAAV